MSETSLTPPPRRPWWLRWLRRLAFVLIVLVTLLALVHAVENFRGKRAWSRYQKDAEARGVKLDFTAHIPAPIPDDENGANTPFIHSWFPKPQPGGDPLWPTNYGYASQLLTVHRRTKGSGAQDDRFFTDLEAWRQAFVNFREEGVKKKKKAETHSHDVERDAKEQAEAALAVLKELQGHDAALVELRAMSSRRKVRYPINYKTEEPFSILLPHLAKMKGVVSLLNLRACAELAAGQTNEAFADVKLAFWVCDSFEEELFLISQLVRIAAQQIVTQPVWEGLARHQWTEPQLKELQERFLRVDFTSALDRTLAEERAGSIAAVEWVLTKRNPAEAFAMFGSDQLPVNTPQGSLIGWLIPSGWFHYEKANLGIFMDEMTAGAWDLPNRQIHARVVDENNRKLTEKFKRGPFHSIWNHYLFARLLMPALEKTSVRFARAQCTAHQAALACALERFYLAEKKYPDSLDALAPKYLAKIPHEVVSANAMRYTKTANGFTLWSVGWDGKDDGGTLLRSAKGEGPDQGDWVWQSAP